MHLNLQSLVLLTYWDRVTHICDSNLTIIGSDNGLWPDRRQAIIWTNAGIFLIEPSGRNFSEILIEIQTFSFKKIHLKMRSGKWRPLCLDLNVMTYMGHDWVAFEWCASWSSLLCHHQVHYWLNKYMCSIRGVVYCEYVNFGEKDICAMIANNSLCVEDFQPCVISPVVMLRILDLYRLYKCGHCFYVRHFIINSCWCVMHLRHIIMNSG